MELTPKAKKILQILLQAEDRMTAQELADQMRVSKRTVQREMDTVSGFLKGTGVDLITKMGKGFWLEGEKEDRQNLLKELQSKDMYDAGDKEERRKRLILEILKEKELKTLSVYPVSAQHQVYWKEYSQLPYFRWIANDEFEQVNDGSC